MKISFLPKSILGKWSLGLFLVFVIFMALKMYCKFFLSTFAIAAVGIAGLITGIIAFFRKDKFILLLLPICMGLIIVVWIIGELLYPH